MDYFVSAEDFEQLKIVELSSHFVFFRKYFGMFCFVPILSNLIFDNHNCPHTFTFNSGMKDLPIINLTLRLLLCPSVEHFPTIFKFLGTGYDEKLLSSTGNVVLKAVVTLFNLDQLLTERPQISTLVDESLIKRATYLSIVLDDVAITHLSYGVEFRITVKKK